MQRLRLNSSKGNSDKNCCRKQKLNKSLKTSSLVNQFNQSKINTYYTTVLKRVDDKLYSTKFTSLSCGCGKLFRNWNMYHVELFFAVSDTIS